MKGRKSITFFMLVTNRDCIIANYAIGSYQKIYEQKQEFGHEDFILYIYLNCLSQENKIRYKENWEKYPYTKVFDNDIKFKSGKYPQQGEKIMSPEGIERNLDDNAESYDELWTTELKKFDTPFVAMVDADFEILNADFYFYLVSLLKNNENIIGASSSYSPTAKIYDTYSKRNIILHERNHTWFCIYRSIAFQLSNISHYYYEETDKNGTIQAFDSASYFQQDLRVKHKLEFVTVPDEYQTSFVHYGASSKNKSLTHRNIGYYRTIFLLSSVGMFYGNRNAGYASLVNKLCRKLTTRFFGNFLNRIHKERSTYIYDDQQSKEV